MTEMQEGRLCSFLLCCFLCSLLCYFLSFFLCWHFSFGPL